jgi:type 1 fimbria pilin
MKNCKLTAILALMAFLATASIAMAHTPLCNCFDNGDGTVTCEGGFSDGSSASGVKMSILDKDGKTLQEGKMDEFSEFSFKKPAGDYTVRFYAGEGHEVTVSSNDIVE